MVWRIIFGAIFLAFAGGLAWQSHNLYEAAEQQHAEYDYQPTSGAGLPQSMRSETPDQVYQPNCDRPQSLEDADLCAQWAVVDQASEANRIASQSLRLSIGALLLTVVGTLLLLWTLHETRSSSRKQLRAYLMVDSVTANTEGLFEARIRWENCGETPAHDIRAAIAVEIAPSPNFNIPEMEDAAVHLGKGKSVNMIDGLIAEDFRSFDPNTDSIWLYGRVDYTDIFGDQHRTDVCLEYAGGTKFKAARGSYTRAT